MAMPHYARLTDFGLLQAFYPNLHSLDLSHIADEFFGTGYSWDDLVRAHPALFSRLKFLKVDVSVHARPSCTVPRGSTKTRNLHYGGLKQLLQASPHLETLALVGPRARSWGRAECQDELSQAIADGAGSQLHTIQLWDMASCIRNFQHFLEPLSRLEHLHTIAINFGETLHFFTRDGDVKDYIRRRDPRKGIKSLYTSTTKDLSQYLTEMNDIVDQGRWNMKSLDRDGDRDVEVRHDPRTLYPLIINNNNEPNGYELLAFMKNHLGWNPVLAWEGIIHPSYPIEHTSLASLPSTQRAVELATLEELLKGIRSLGMPVKVEVSAEHTSSQTFFGAPSSLAAASSSTGDWFLNDRLAPLVDELRITYGGDTYGDDGEEKQPQMMIRPGRIGGGTRECWHGRIKKESSVPEFGDQAVDGLSFRPFWKMFAERFTSVKCVKVNVPAFVFGKWTDRELEEVLGGVDGAGGNWVVTRLDDDSSSGNGNDDRVRAIYSNVSN